MVSTTRSPGWAGFGEAEIVHESMPTEPVSRTVVVVARGVVVVGRCVVVVARATVVVVALSWRLAPLCSVRGQPSAGAGMMSSGWSS